MFILPKFSSIIKPGSVYLRINPKAGRASAAVLTKADLLEVSVSRVGLFGADLLRVLENSKLLLISSFSLFPVDNVMFSSTSTYLDVSHVCCLRMFNASISNNLNNKECTK